MSKKILFICRQPPYGSSLAREALDAVLASSAYGQELAVLFMDDGIFQLLDNQQAELIEQKSFSKMLPALPLYDVEQLYVCAHSLKERGLTSGQLCLPVNSLTRREIKQLMAQQHSLLSF